MAIEPGDDPIAIAPGSYALTDRGSSATFECWNTTRNLARRVRAVRHQSRGRLDLEVERFPRSSAALTLADLDDPSNRDATRRGSRFKFRERFRRALRRQFPGWRIAELSTDPDLHHTLSPSYPRAFLRNGSAGLAAIGAAEDALAPEAVLSFGLIWLDYLRQREPRVSLHTLAIFVPAAAAAVTAHRIRFLNPDLAACALFLCDPAGASASFEDRVDPGDYTNFDTRLDPLAAPQADPALLNALAAIEAVERRDHPSGSVSFAIRGLEFAHLDSSGLRAGIDRKERVNPSNLREIEDLARGLARLRAPSAQDRQNPLYTRHPEAWLESRIRGGIEKIDATLLPAPIYGQVPQFAGGERSVIDLLAVDRDGRLAVIEIKAGEDIHLPLQALDYWMRVKWHLDRGEFSGRGYFPGIELSRRPPRLLLISPALDYHPSNETVLRYVSPDVPVERIGVAVEWREELRVMFTRCGARGSTPTSWHSQS